MTSLRRNLVVGVKYFPPKFHSVKSSGSEWKGHLTRNVILGKQKTDGCCVASNSLCKNVSRVFCKIHFFSIHRLCVKGLPVDFWLGGRYWKKNHSESRVAAELQGLIFILTEPETNVSIRTELIPIMNTFGSDIISSQMGHLQWQIFKMQMKSVTHYNIFVHVTPNWLDIFSSVPYSKLYSYFWILNDQV